MTTLGFYFLYADKYNMVKSIAVPWDFEINAPDGVLPQYDRPIIGEWENKKTKYYALPYENIIQITQHGLITDAELTEMVGYESDPESDLPIYRAYMVVEKATGIDIIKVLKTKMNDQEWADFLDKDIVRPYLEGVTLLDNQYLILSDDGYANFRVEILPMIYQYIKPTDIDMIEVMLVYTPENIPDQGIMPLTDTIDLPLTPIEPTPSEVPTIPIEPIPSTRNNFPKWITEYLYNVLIPQKGFLDVFNNNRTYIIIPVDSPMDMGIMRVSKGKTTVDFEESSS